MTTPATSGQVSTMSPVPFGLLRIVDSGFVADAETSVRYFDNGSYTIEVPAVFSDEMQVTVGVPPYFDRATGRIESHVVSLEVIQKVGSGQEVSHRFDNVVIQDAPDYGQAPGTVTMAFLKARLITEQNLQLSLVGTGLDTPDNCAALAKHVADLEQLTALVDGVMQGSISTFNLGGISGQSLPLGTSDLLMADRLLLSELGDELESLEPGASQQGTSAQDCEPQETATKNRAAQVALAADTPDAQDRLVEYIAAKCKELSFGASRWIHTSTSAAQLSVAIATLLVPGADIPSGVFLAVLLVIDTSMALCEVADWVAEGHSLEQPEGVKKAIADLRDSALSKLLEISDPGLGVFYDATKDSSDLVSGIRDIVTTKLDCVADVAVSPWVGSYTLNAPGRVGRGTITMHGSYGYDFVPTPGPRVSGAGTMNGVINGDLLDIKVQESDSVLPGAQFDLFRNDIYALTGDATEISHDSAAGTINYVFFVGPATGSFRIVRLRP